MFQDKDRENVQSQSSDIVNKGCLNKKSSMESYDSGYLSISPSKSHRSTYQSDLSLYFTKKSYKTKFDSYKFKYKQTCDASNSYLLSSTPKRSTINYSHSQLSGYKSPSQCPQNSFKMELRSQKKIRRKPLEPSNHTHKYSANDMNMKLLVPQSTPNFFNSPILPSSVYKIGFSPINYKVSPRLNCIKSKKFCNLSINENIYASKKKRPKRLDFSKRAILSTFQKHRVTADYTGKENVDIFKLLVDKSNHPRIVTKILSYLNLQDLCSVTMVSKSWQRICNNDIKAEERRLKYITLKQCSKENILLSKSKLEDLVQVTPKARYSRRGLLTAVSINLLQVPKMHFKPDSPPVSPSKVIFNSFIKASRSLPLHDQLVPCPQCKFACRVKNDNNTGICSRQGCPMSEFCILCSSELHLGKPCKMSLLATPTKRSIKQHPVVGTKQCKRNLRRILRLI